MPDQDFATLLLLIMVANGAPLPPTRLLGSHLDRPLDGGVRLADGHELFGNAKTLRGVAAAITLTPLAAVILQRHWTDGLLIAVAAMFGDLLASFVKRRMGIAPHGMAFGLDQIPESLLPALLVRSRFELGWPELAFLVTVFTILELLLSRLLYRLRLRDRPY